MPELLGPFCPDMTSMLVRRGGKVVALERGRGCERVAGIAPILDGRVERVPMDAKLALATPLAFFAGQGLAIQFDSAEGDAVPEDAEAFLVVTYAAAG